VLNGNAFRFDTTKRHGDHQHRGARGHGNGPAAALQ
jgi:hypothetical protein